MRVLLTGASGRLGPYILEALAPRADSVVTWSRSPVAISGSVAWRGVDLTQESVVRGAFDDARPDVTIHAAAISEPAVAARQPDLARAVNVMATGLLAQLAQRARSHLLYLSTDMVFDGRKGHYREEDSPNPISVYGQSKLHGERTVLDRGGLVVRLSLMYGPARGARVSFFDEQVRALRDDRPLRLYDDEFRTPIYFGDAAKAIVAAARCRTSGVLHLGGPQRLSRLEFGRQLAAAMGVTGDTIIATSRTAGSPSEPRPADLSLESDLFDQRVPGVPRRSPRAVLASLLTPAR